MKKNKPCKHCGQVLRNQENVYCDTACRMAAGRKTNQCRACFVLYIPNYREQKYCSNTCRVEAYY